MQLRLIASALVLLTLLTACKPSLEPKSASGDVGNSSSASSSERMQTSSDVESSVPESSAPASSSIPEQLPVETPASSVPVESQPPAPPVVIPPAQDNLLVLAERADETSVESTPEQDSLPADAKELTLLLVNGSEQEISGDFYFTLEKREDGQWNRVRFKEDAAFPDLAWIARPGETTRQIFSLELFAQPLTPGEYRVSRTVSSPERSFVLTSTFELGAPMGQLELKKPHTIKLTINSGAQTHKATLTLKQRYQDMSAVSYAMEQLGGFVPLADNQTVIQTEGSEGALLTLSYPDGLQRELLLDPLGALQLEDGSLQPVTRLLDGKLWYYSEDTEIYERLFACAESLGDATA